MVRDRIRQPGKLRRAKQIRQAEQHAERADPADQQNLPVGEVEHQAAGSYALSGSSATGSLSLAGVLAPRRRGEPRSLAASRAAPGSVLAMTVEMLLRSTRTGPPGPSPPSTPPPSATRLTFRI